MALKIYVTKDFDQMSSVAAGLVEADIKEKQAVKKEYVLGLATGNSPTGLYKHLAKSFNALSYSLTMYGRTISSCIK